VFVFVENELIDYRLDLDKTDSAYSPNLDADG
jgi:hypothetical protein